MTATWEPPAEINPIDRMEPHDIGAEQAVLGSCMINADAARYVLRKSYLDSIDFYRPLHRTIFENLQYLDAHGDAIDAMTVAARLQQTVPGFLANDGPIYLHHLTACVPTAANAEYYARIIRSTAISRGVIHLGTEIAELGYNPAVDPFDAAEQAVAKARAVRDRGRQTTEAPVMDMYDFLTIEDEYDWVLPGYLERGDRVIWTAGEGGGKSMLLRQIAVTGAAGLLPFGGGANERGPQRVLVLDCENSGSQSRRRYRHLMNTAERVGYGVKRGQLHIDCRPEGVDLTRADGRAWLMRRVEAVMPDLVVIGPIYQLHQGDPNSEDHARRVTTALNEARATAGCALVMEAHAPHSNGFGPRALRPAGSSVWLRWPEFGYGLRAVEDERSAEQCRARRVVPWRGARDERHWPLFVKQGDDWPWRKYTPLDADEYGNSSTGAT